MTNFANMTNSKNDELQKITNFKETTNFEKNTNSDQILFININFEKNGHFRIFLISIKLNHKKLNSNAD